MDDLRSLLTRFGFGLWRKRWLAIGIAWVLCVAGWFAVAAIPDQYEATARIYVDVDAVLTPLLRGIALDNTPVSQLEVLQHTALSRPNLEKLISKTDLELQIAGPTDLERAVLNLAEGIKLTPQTHNLFTITYRNTSPKLAYDVVQQFLTIFIESKAGTNRADMENARQFLEQQITQYEQKLRLAESKRAEFRTKYLDLLPSDSSGMTRLEAARNTLAQLEEHIKDASLRHDMLKQQLDATPETYAAEAQAALGGGGGGGNSVLAEAERRLRELRLRYTDQHPDVVTARNIVESLKANPPPAEGGGGRTAAAPGHTRSASNPIYEQLKLQLFENEGQLASLQRQITDETKDRDRLASIARGAPGLIAEYTDLNRDYDVLRKNHEELISRRESMRIASAADTDAEKVKLDVVDPPQVPRIPVTPKRVLLDTAVLALGFAGGIGVALMLLQFDSSFQTTDELRKLELPVAGSISMIAAVVPLHRRVLGAGSMAMAVLLLCAVWGGLIMKMLRAGIA
jgi:polysaccharide chain length determinant protein (PEP-CTERM system associated)